MTTDTLTQPAIQERMIRTQAKQMDQYTLWQVLGIWALVALPMALLGWVVAPAIIPHIPLPPGITYWLLMIAGMAWQFVVSITILYRELGTLRWSAIRRRTWLQTPRDTKTDQPNSKLFWWLLPAIILSALVGLVLGKYLNAPLAWLFPALKPAQFMDMSSLVPAQFHGQWWLLGIALVSFAFNYFLGEEFLFRGVLLPRMQGVFGKYDWVANAILFGLYHLHKPWGIPTIVVGSLANIYPARRFRSNWMAIIAHGMEMFMMLAIILPVILG